MNIASLCFRVSAGIDQTACTLIGQAIGSGNIKEAIHYYNILKLFTIVITICVCMTLNVFKNNLVRMYTNDDIIVAQVIQILWIQNITQFPDNYKGFMRGVIKALAK